MRLILRVVILGLCMGWPGAGAAAERPNVVVILADDLGYSDLGCYGGEIATPNLDALAKNGVRFTQFYNTARCWPTRAALLTGYYAQAIRRDQIPGAKGGSNGNRPKWARLLPAYLKSHGYRSYHSGKWHIDGSPLEGGFDHAYRLEDVGRYFRPQSLQIDDQPQPKVPPGTNYYNTVAITEHAITCLKKHAAEHAKRPFFQYVAFPAPHFPLQALPEDIERYREKYTSGWDILRQTRHARQRAMQLVNCELSPVERNVGPPYPFPQLVEKLGVGEVLLPLPWKDLTAEQQAFQAAKMAIHAAMVDRMDREIGRILDQLRAMQVFDKTLILFASDNGATAEIMIRDDGHDPAAAPGSAATHLCLGPGFSSLANTPFRRHKTWVYEGGISSPLIAHWPSGIASRGDFRTTPAHVVDVVPTVLELAGITRPETWDGVPLPAGHGASLVPALKGNVEIPRDALWWLHEGNRAIRQGDWKLVAAKNQPWELYDLKTDRCENRNLASEQPDRVREMEQAWAEKLEQFRILARESTNK